MATMTWVLLCWLMLVIQQDAWHRRVPNALVLAGAGLAVSAWFLDAQPFGANGGDLLLGGAAAFGALLFFYFFDLMGAGDVKFAGALGLWFGLSPLLPIWIGASLLAGLHALAWLALRRWPRLPRLAMALDGRPGTRVAGRRVRRIPYAAYLAIAAIAALFRHAGT